MTEKEFRYHNLYMDIAKRVALMSYAVRTKVGSVLVKDDSIVAYGFNGMPAGMDNICETLVDGALVTKPECQHAELNMFSKLLKSGVSTLGSKVYVTLSPCINCAMQIGGAGIREVYYDEEYRSSEGVDYLKGRGTHVRKL